MPVRIGVNPTFWSNDDMQDVGSWITLEQCLSQAMNFGFSGIELGHKFPRTPDALAPLLKSHGLALVSGGYSSTLLKRSVSAELRAAKFHRLLLKAMKAKVMIVAETTGSTHQDMNMPLAARPALDRSGWKTFASKLSLFALRLKEQDGITLVYHPHMGTVIQNGGEIDRLMDTTGDHVKLILDTGQAAWAGDNPARIAKTWKHRIRHVHCKDIRLDIKMRAERDQWSFPKAILNGVFTVPGDGAVDFASVFHCLKGYSGWIVLKAEQDVRKAPPDKIVPMGLRHLKMQLAEAGLI